MYLIDLLQALVVRRLRQANHFAAIGQGALAASIRAVVKPLAITLDRQRQKPGQTR